MRSAPHQSRIAATKNSHPRMIQSGESWSTFTRNVPRNASTKSPPQPAAKYPEPVGFSLISFLHVRHRIKDSPKPAKSRKKDLATSRRHSTPSTRVIVHAFYAAIRSEERV